MGAHCSIHNDTPNETVMVFVGVNTKVIQPLLLGITGAATIWSGGVALGTVPATTTLLGGTATATVTGATAVGGEIAVATITAVAGGFVSASNYCLDRYCLKLVHDLTKGGYHTLLPGQSFTSKSVSPGLNLRAWLVRIHRTPHSIEIKRCSGSVWSALRPGENKVYRVLDKTVFRTWTKHYESIPMPTENLLTHSASSDTVDNNTDNHQNSVVEEENFVDAVEDSNEESPQSAISDNKHQCSQDENSLQVSIPTKIIPLSKRQDSITTANTRTTTREEEQKEEEEDDDDDICTTYTFLDSKRTNAPCTTSLVKEHQHQHDDDAWIQID